MDRPTSPQLVDQAIEAVRSGELSLAECSARYGAQWPQIEGQVRLALKLDAAGHSFKSELPPPDLTRMWAAIQPQLQGQLVQNAADSGSNPALDPEGTIRLVRGQLPASRPARRKWPLKPLAWVAAILIFGLVTLFGSAQASEPGDPTYGVKLWVDGAGQLLAGSPLDKANAALTYAEHRLQEIESLLRKGRSEHLPLAVGEYNRALSNLLSVGGDLSEAQVNQLVAQRDRLLSFKVSLFNNPNTSEADLKSVQQMDNLVKQIDDGVMVVKPGYNLTPTPTPISLLTATATLNAELTATVALTATAPVATPSISAGSPGAATPTATVGTTTNPLTAEPSAAATNSAATSTPEPAATIASSATSAASVPPTPSPVTVRQPAPPPLPIRPPVVPTVKPEPPKNPVPLPTAVPPAPPKVVPTVPAPPQPTVPDVEPPKPTKPPKVEPPKPTDPPKDDKDKDKDKDPKPPKDKPKK